ncbi:hypothetical protein [Thalassobacillus sp. CUG 92003]|uniref:hypothetical protein n=1 Tax=Thalassobacillus sp. CUG 92003 TaxID=2736641 RepID=UPI0015E7AAF6|nr:hypothetical protein [Thalassobacillus sp. CUG 92003]
MSKKKKNDHKEVYDKVIDMLVNTTLNRHGVKLDKNKIDQKNKEELKKMVEELKNNVNSLSKTEKEE